MGPDNACGTKHHGGLEYEDWEELLINKNLVARPFRSLNYSVALDGHHDV